MKREEGERAQGVREPAFGNASGEFLSPSPARGPSCSSKACSLATSPRNKRRLDGLAPLQGSRAVGMKESLYSWILPGPSWGRWQRHRGHRQRKSSECRSGIRALVPLLSRQLRRHAVRLAEKSESDVNRAIWLTPGSMTSCFMQVTIA